MGGAYDDQQLGVVINSKRTNVRPHHEMDA